MLHFLGFLLLVVGGVMLIPVPAAYIFTEAHLVPSFVVPALTAITLGFLLRKRFRPTELTLGKAMVVVTFTWILFSAFSSVPYVFGNHMPAEDAYFESMSGLTATGLTMISDVEGTARTILFWRSLTEWIGGVGIVILFLSALLGFGKAA
ncbi:MAG TPA: TrkH family potassium uptake protein, partial [Hadesarchaea archaeon]|nr:TrkH family potassium uptake protein [Hadesarchaea archaeon]